MTDILTQLFEHVNNIKVDGWVVFGLFGGALFFMRMIIQWIASERHKKIVVPITYWYLSIIGAVFILIYSIKRQDIVYILSSILNTAIFSRNLWIALHSTRNNET